MSTPKSNVCILIAEDEAIIFYYLKSVITSVFQKAEILKARNGKEAVDLVKNNPDIDLILMDLGMPKMNGTEACRIIKEEIGRTVPIVAQTAYGHILAETNLFDDILYKPVKPAAIRIMIKKYLKLDNMRTKE